MNTKRLIELRKSKDLTQEEVANELECTQEMISAIENGKKKGSISLIHKMAKLYNVPIEELINENEG